METKYGKIRENSEKEINMEINEQITKQITETAYLTKENTKRYRPILRFFFEENEKMNYFLYKEDVYEEFVGKEYFENYTIEQAESDLTSLVEWKNLIPIQDTERAYSVEEFKHKKYRYQLSEYTIEIERLILKLENLHIEGSSLEPTLIERMKEQIEKADVIANKSSQEVYGWWEELNENFKRLNEKYKDYIRSFYNIKMEEVAQSTQFILRKSDLVRYLKQFIKILQDNSYQIEEKLSSISTQTEQTILRKVLEEQRNTIRIDTLEEEFPEEQMKQRNEGKWENLKRWFIGSATRQSEVVSINEKTSEIIRKITRIANQIAESKGNISSRKAEYKKIAEMFCATNSLEEAHKLSSLVFGMVNTRHIKGDFVRQTDSINSKLTEEEPFLIEIKPRLRGYKEKTERVLIEDKTEEKKRKIEEYMKQREQERQEFEQYIQENKIEIEKLPEIKPNIRKMLLKLIGRANQSEIKETKTEDGRIVKLIYPPNQERCVLHCEDGNLEMPAFILEIEDK